MNFVHNPSASRSFGTSLYTREAENAVVRCLDFICNLLRTEASPFLTLGLSNIEKALVLSVAEC